MTPGSNPSHAAGEVFTSRLDAWMLLLVAIGVLTPLVLVSSPKLSGTEATISRLIVGASLLLVLLFISWFMRTTSYTIGAYTLLVRSGPLSWSIPFSDIRTVRPTHNPVSAPALSLRRLEIRYGEGGFMLVSPRDRARFLQLLKARAPGAEITG